MRRNFRLNKKSYINILLIIIAILFIDLLDINEKHIPVKKIISIHDGDTVKVVNNKGETVKIRLYGIDAPELKQQYGKSAQKCLSQLISNKTITYVPEKRFSNSSSKDKYGRVVAVLYNEDININREMIKKGCAWNYFRYNYSLYGEYLEYKAKENMQGLWQYDNPQAPWDFRANKNR